MGATVAQLVSALYNLPLPNKQSQENKLVDTVNINTRWLDNWENTPVNENEKLMLTTIVGQPKSIISVCWNGPRQTTYPLKKKKNNRQSSLLTTLWTNSNGHQKRKPWVIHFGSHTYPFGMSEVIRNTTFKSVWIFLISWSKKTKMFAVIHINSIMDESMTKICTKMIYVKV